jgi:hypothetical protein
MAIGDLSLSMMIATPTTGAARAVAFPETSPAGGVGRDHTLAFPLIQRE